MKQFLNQIAGPCRLLVAGMLTFSAVSHLDNPYLYLRSVYDYQLFPPLLAEMAAAWLPWLQFVIALALVSRVAGHGPAAVATGLLSIFVGAQMWAYASGSTASCGCFGYSTDAVGPVSIAISAGCALCAAVAWIFDHEVSDEPAPAVSLSAIDSRSPQ